MKQEFKLASKDEKRDMKGNKSPTQEEQDEERITREKEGGKRNR